MTTASHFSLLVVDDEPDLRTLYELTLRGLRPRHRGHGAGSAAASQGPHLQRGHHRHAPARRQRPRRAALARGEQPAREGDRHHRLRLVRERGRGAEGGRLRLPHQAGRPEAVPRRRRLALGRGGGGPTSIRRLFPRHRASAPPRAPRPVAAPGAGAGAFIAACPMAQRGHAAGALLARRSRAAWRRFSSPASQDGKDWSRAHHESARVRDAVRGRNCSAIPSRCSSRVLLYAKAPHRANGPRRLSRRSGARSSSTSRDLPLSMQPSSCARFRSVVRQSAPSPSCPVDVRC